MAFKQAADSPTYAATKRQHLDLTEATTDHTAAISLTFLSMGPLRRALLVDFGTELMQRWSPRWLERRFAIDFVPKGLATLAYCFELALVELEDFGAPLVPRWPALLCASGRCTGLSGGLHYMSCCLPACASVCLLPGFVRGVMWSSWTSASCAAHAALVSAMAGAPIRDRLHAAAAGWATSSWTRSRRRQRRMLYAAAGWTTSSPTCSPGGPSGLGDYFADTFVAL